MRTYRKIAVSKYIEFVEKELEVPIKIVSNGPSREDIILK